MDNRQPERLGAENSNLNSIASEIIKKNKSDEGYADFVRQKLAEIKKINNGKVDFLFSPSKGSPDKVNLLFYAIRTKDKILFDELLKDDTIDLKSRIIAGGGILRPVSIALSNVKFEEDLMYFINAYIDKDKNFLYTFLDDSIWRANHELLEKLLLRDDLDQKWFDGKYGADNPRYSVVCRTPLTDCLTRTFSLKSGESVEGIKKTAILLIRDKRMVNLDAAIKQGLKQAESKTALMIAIENLDVELVKCLLEEGADPNIRSIDGSNALSLAYDCKKLEVFKLLLDEKYRTKVNALYKQTARTLVHVLAESGEVEFLECLLRAGADINLRDGRSPHNNPGRFTPLMVAAMRNHKKIIDLLLEKFSSRVDLELKDSWGRTALHLATDYFSKECIDALLKGGADVNARVSPDDPKTSVIARLIANRGNRDLSDKKVAMEGLMADKYAVLKRLMQEKELELTCTVDFSLVKYAISEIDFFDPELILELLLAYEQIPGSAFNTIWGFGAEFKDTALYNNEDVSRVKLVELMTRMHDVIRYDSPVFFLRSFEHILAQLALSAQQGKAGARESYTALAIKFREIMFLERVSARDNHCYDDEDDEEEESDLTKVNNFLLLSRKNIKINGSRQLTNEAIFLPGGAADAIRLTQKNYHLAFLERFLDEGKDYSKRTDINKILQKLGRDFIAEFSKPEGLPTKEDIRQISPEILKAMVKAIENIQSFVIKNRELFKEVAKFSEAIGRSDSRLHLLPQELRGLIFEYCSSKEFSKLEKLKSANDFDDETRSLMMSQDSFVFDEGEIASLDRINSIMREVLQSNGFGVEKSGVFEVYRGHLLNSVADAKKRREAENGKRMLDGERAGADVQSSMHSEKFTRDVKRKDEEDHDDGPDLKKKSGDVLQSLEPSSASVSRAGARRPWERERDKDGKIDDEKKNSGQLH